MEAVRRTIHVLDFGRILAVGHRPSEIRDDEGVQTAYLGQPG